ncbi:MAG: GNAT family N-acetyltransferase [Propionibacteriaceae bacterium]|nr:GNAT family N-acetyltransferase [Propionibacteriaceae bacterium]
MAVTVRPVAELDLSVLRGLQARPELQLVDQHFAAAQKGELIFAVAVEGDERLGTALLDFGPDAFVPELRNMYVYPGARRRGAGRALMSWLEEQARIRGYTAVYLAVDPNNERAIPLYVSLEYSPTGEHLFVADAEIPQVADGTERSTHYAIYKKSLLAL